MSAGLDPNRAPANGVDAAQRSGSGAARLYEVFRQELRFNLRRPLFWIWILIMGFLTWGLSTGSVRVMASGDSAVGGTKAWITSEYAQAQYLSVFILMFYAFFVAVAAGMAILRDEEAGVSQVLHSTRLRPGEYAWGKFLACLTTFALVLVVHQSLSALFNHTFVSGGKAEYVGPFELRCYLSPALYLAAPTLLFLAGVSFAVGELARRPILVFFLPVALLLVSVFFLWTWTPTWLDARADRLLMLIDPSGYRWLQQTWLKDDRGVEFYNHARVGYDAGFLASRAIHAAIGVLAVVWSSRHFARSLAGERAPRGQATAATLPGAGPVRDSKPLRELGMSTRPMRWTAQAWEIARIELRELRSQPGLYLFVPLILLQTVGSSLYSLGAFDTPNLATSGTVAVSVMNTLTLLVCLLLLFYTVESLERERVVGLDGVLGSGPVRSGALLAGKTLANSVVAVAVLLAAFVGCACVLLWQGKVALELRPFLLAWGVLLLPTFIVWCSFVACVRALVRNRYTTYALCLSALMFSGYRQATGQMNWVGNWDLWSAVLWSDLGWLPIDAKAVLLNRLMVLSASVLFVVLAVRLSPRKVADSAVSLERLQPLRLVRACLPIAPLAAVPVALGIALWIAVQAGFEGDAYEKKAKDYWRANVATWQDAPGPEIASADVTLELEPERRWLRSRGAFSLLNRTDKPLRQFALTTGPHWRETSWTLDGVAATPEGKTLLQIFTPERPLEPGARIALVFAFEGTFPEGITENGGGAGEFVLPCGAVLTSFGPSFVPVLGFMEGLGVDEDNRYDSKVYPEDFHLGQTDSAFGSNAPYPVRVSITGPADWTLNSVGELASDEVKDGRRTSVWRTEHPVNFFNVVAGRWTEKRGAGTVIYYHPDHAWNVEEMSAALDAARKHYSEWFMEYPWKELKLSEFAGLAGYGQGFPTNITFSESIGFLTKSDPKTQLAWFVTAHESAHQWWGNLLAPGEGPGGNLLSEGLAHFSTAMLLEAEKGPRGRIEFMKRIEERYGERRQLDSERPLIKIDGTKSGDTTVTYDKGGWVFWMLLDFLGRERGLAGYRDFIGRYHENPDHPTLPDFLAVMREHADDAAAFDAFAQQWFREVVLPEYALTEARCVAVPSDEWNPPRWRTTVTLRNKGSGRMPVEVAVTRGERFPEKDAKTPTAAAETDRDPEALSEVAALAARGSNGLGESTDRPADTGTPPGMAARAAAEYFDARAQAVLGASEESELVILSDFEPERVLVDPDVRVLQLGRKRAILRL